MIEKDKLKRYAETFGLTLGPIELEQFDIYAQLLVEWNERMNLTAITQAEEIEDKHFIDCMPLAACPQLGESLVDVGSGAGFPGVVVKILRPQVALTLLEPTGKRVTFLQALCAQLGLQVAVEKERAEEAGRKHWRESFSTATARAVAPLPMLCEYCLPLVQPGGYFIAMKAEAEQELVAAQRAIEKCGGEYQATQPYTLPDGAARSLVLIEKLGATPQQYPRNGGVIKKRPL